jgi:hypothetical protein
LLPKVKTLVPEEVIEQCLHRKEPIYLASDGVGAIPGRASFGWILQIGTTKIARGKGPTYGDGPRSFRAEGYGMASALVYLRILYKHFEIKRERTSINKIICDNKGLLTRIEESSEWDYATPNVTLRAKWDIEPVILGQLKHMDMKFIYMHVKSHQDDDAEVASLSLETRLNFKADCLATEYMTEDRTRRPPSRCSQALKLNSLSKMLPLPGNYRQQFGSQRAIKRFANT